MLNRDEDILQAAENWQKAGHGVALATVVETWGSAPRPAGSSLVIERTTGMAHCRSCGRDFALADLILLCSCGSADVHLVAGQELRVLSVELVVEPCA